MPMEKIWSHPVVVADIPDTGSHIELSADVATRGTVAKLAGLRDLPRLEAVFDLVRRGEGVAVTGEVTAQVGQTCVVTLEPMESEVRERVDIVFAPETGAGEGDGKPARRKAKGEPPEHLENGVVDLGAIATEFLILGIDPYPRKDGAEFTQPNPSDEKAKPFAALATLKKRS